MKQFDKAKSWTKLKWNQGFAKLKKQKINTTIGIVIASMCVTGTALASHYYNSNTNTLYHVYLDGQDLGTIDNPDLINQYVDKQLAEEKEKYPSLKLSADKLELKEEREFKGSVNDNQTLDAFKQKFQITAAAEALVIDGKEVGYAKDKETVDSVINQLKAKFTPTAGENETVQSGFKENVSEQEANVDPEKLLAADQLSMLIQKGTIEQAVHKVQPGDTISRIAKQYGITSKVIYDNNPGITEDTVLKINQPLIVTASKPLLTVEVVREKEMNEVVDYQTKYVPADDLFRGDSQVVQEGKQGAKKVTYKIVEDNGVRQEKTPIKEEVASQPVDQIIKKGTKIKPSRGDGKFAWPTYGGVITSTYGPRWGEFHKGIDIAGVSNRNIKAADNGRVILASWYSTYGNCVIIDHDNGFQTVYGHLSSIKVSVGDIVQKGDILGVMGETGDATGVHLHFEVRKDGETENPLQFLTR